MTTAARGFARARETLPALSEPLRQSFAHMQIFAIMPSIVSVQWPSSITSIADGLVSWIAFDFELPSIVCEYPQTLSDRIAFSLLLSLALLAASPLTYCTIRLLYGKCTTPLHKAILHAFWERCSLAYLIICLIVYAPTSSIAFRYFTCGWFGDGWYNRYDLTLQCYNEDGIMTEAYRSGLPLAVLTIALIAFGIPAINLSILWRLKQSGQLEADSTKRAFGMLYSKYTSDAWWWESVELTKRLCFTSALAFFDGQRAYQSAIGLAAAFLILVLHSNIHPYKERSDSLISMTTHIGVFSLALLALEVEAGYTPPVVAIIGLTLLPLWVIAFATCIYLPAKALAALLRKKAPGLGARMDALPEALSRGLFHSLELLEHGFVLGLQSFPGYTATKAKAVGRRLSQSRASAGATAGPAYTSSRAESRRPSAPAASAPAASMERKSSIQTDHI